MVLPCYKVQFHDKYYKQLQNETVTNENKFLFLYVLFIKPCNLFCITLLYGLFMQILIVLLMCV